MGYYLQAFICKEVDCENFIKTFNNARRITLDQGLVLIPMSEELFEEINNLKLSPSIEKFEFINENIEQLILNVMENKKVAYIEAEYFGGDGGQSVIIWDQNKRLQILEFGQDRINQVLKFFGIIADKGIDEFETLGFHLRRSTQKWLD